MEKNLYETEFSQRLGWRQKYWVENLKQLDEITSNSFVFSKEPLPQLFKKRVSDNPVDSFAWSIMGLWYQATECYIFDLHESAILTCGAILDRCLKIEILQCNQQIPPKWTLGKLTHNYDWKKTQINIEILDLVKECLHPRNSRAHALLELDDPQSAILGGNREVTIVSEHRNLVHPYKSDSKLVIKNTWQILQILFS